MNIAQIKPQAKLHPSSEPNQAHTESALENMFKHQLEFAESDIQQLTSHVLRGEDLRDYREKIEEKRQNDDAEKLVALSHWNDQQQRSRFEEGARSKSQANESRLLTAKEIDNSRKQAVDFTFNTKHLNQDLSRERIIQQKPHLISSALQEDTAETPKPEFAEILKTKSEAQTPHQLQSSNKATYIESPIDADAIRYTPNQAQPNRLDRDSLISKLSAEKPEGSKPIAIQTNTQRSNAPFDYQLSKQDTPLTGEKSAKSPAKAGDFTAELNASLKNSENADVDPAVKQAQIKEAEQANAKNVVSNVKIMLSSGKDTIILRLTPEHLGKLEIKLKKAGDRLSGEFKVESAEAKRLLASELGQLKQELENQGITLDHFVVFVKGEEQGSLAHQFKHGQQNSLDDGNSHHLSAVNNGSGASMSPQSPLQTTEDGLNIII